MHGEADGAPVLHKSGVIILKRKNGSAHVSQQALNDTLKALERLPAADLALIANSKIPILLIPVGGLEDSLLGATTIVQDSDGKPWRPTLIRIAVNARDRHDPTAEIVQHEVGHAVSVIRRQDRSERAAENYARQY